MADIRSCSQPEGGRVETGPVRFGDDWPGVFIRGDNAGGLANEVGIVLAGISPSKQFLERLQNLFSSCEIGQKNG